MNNSNILYSNGGRTGFTVTSIDEGLEIAYNGDLDYDRTIVIPWNVIIMAMPISALKQFHKW